MGRGSCCRERQTEKKVVLLGMGKRPTGVGRLKSGRRVGGTFEKEGMKENPFFLGNALDSKKGDPLRKDPKMVSL